MNENKINSIFKFVAIIGIAIIAISISYYFVIYIPHKDALEIQMLKDKETAKAEMEREKDLIEKKLKAAEISQKLRKEFNNVHNVYYDETAKEFIVSYYKQGKQTEALLDDFGAVH